MKTIKEQENNVITLKIEWRLGSVSDHESFGEEIVNLLKGNLPWLTFQYLAKECAIYAVTNFLRIEKMDK